jgi:SAM-dependent methyltransferase
VSIVDQLAGCGRRRPVELQLLDRTVSIVEDYSRQHRWRSWPVILDCLPKLDGHLVLDLGCGIGDLAADLSSRGAHVIGFDINQEFVAFANDRRIPNAEFRVADLRTIRDSCLRADGIWSSFTAAYFTSFCDTVSSWIDLLRPGGWLALTEIDDLFGHQPISNRTSELLDRYVRDSMEHSRYDFLMGRKIADELRKIGLTVTQEFTVPDAELSFSGRAAPEVLEAWQTRFNRMTLLHEFCGPEFQEVRDDFLNCLKRDDHYCSAAVQCCIANNNGSPPHKGRRTLR